MNTINIYDDSSLEYLREVVWDLTDKFIKEINEHWTPDSTRIAYDVKLDKLDRKAACALSIYKMNNFCYMNINTIVHPNLLLNRSSIVGRGKTIDILLGILDSDEGKEEIVESLRRLLLKAYDEDDDDL